MRTAYDALRFAVIKDFGKWYSFEWPYVAEDAKERLRNGAAYQHFGNPFLTNLSDLYVGEGVIRGKLNGGWDFGEEYENNLRKLKAPFVYHWFVYSSFSFDDWFELRGFKDKADAVAFYKKQQAREDSLFYTFWFKM